MVERLEREDIQGIVASAYPHLKKSRYLLLTIDPKRAAEARRWLGNLANTITTAASKHETQSLNVALTYNGLKSLRMELGVLESFSIPFIEGMTSKRRKHILDDSNEPLRWGDDPAKPVDVLLMAFARTTASLDESTCRLITDAKRCGLNDVVSLDGRLHDDSREHFGFVDGIGQPVIEGFEKKNHNKPVHERDVVKNGEFILGYTNEYGYSAEAPKLGLTGKLGRNGTYLVFRQTSQDVAGFWNFIDCAAGHDPIKRELLAAKIVGRWKNGAPLVKAPNAETGEFAAHRHADAANDFGFAEDPDGFRCPLGAHIRRANPRDGSHSQSAAASPAHSARHRLLRRGRSYGSRFDSAATSDRERGLHFIALCADIERQFEFVQQTWINNPAFNDLDEVDPLVGGQSNGAATFTIQAGPLRRRVSGMQRFVKLQGGAYFFVPSIAALRWFAEMERPSSCPES